MSNTPTDPKGPPKPKPPSREDERKLWEAFREASRHACGALYGYRNPRTGRWVFVPMQKLDAA